MVRWLAIVLCLFSGANVLEHELRAQPSGLSGSDAVVELSTAWSQSGVEPGGNLTLAAILDVKPPYHINAAKTREFFIPTVVELADAPAFVRSSTPVYPPSHPIQFGEGDAVQSLDVYSGRVVVFIPIAVTSAATPGAHELTINVTVQACDDQQCLFPEELVQTVTLPVVADASSITPLNQEIFEQMQELQERLDMAFFGWDFQIEPSNLVILLLIAAAGGFLLNLTPCVLPLVPIKIMGLSSAATNRRKCFVLGLVMSFGVVFFWLALATAILTITGFNAANKLFQYPAFTITVGVIICIMAIGMCGLFAVRLPQWVYRFNPGQETYSGSFGFGIMIAVLSTPCTAPFMGAAAAWSTTQAAFVTLATFAAIGAGMALPYLILAAFPALVHRMPRTGPASELIKQVMGLLLLAAGSYFLGTGIAGVVAQPPDPPTNAYWWAVAVFIAAAGVWLVWRTFRISSRVLNRLLFGGLGCVIVGVGLWIGLRFTEGSPIRWTYYTAERLAAAQEAKKVVVLEFTAAWCLNCHALEQGVLHNPRVVELLNSEQVAPVKVDITGNNPEGNAKLVEVGRRTIPYLVIYDPGGEVVFASDAYSVEQVVRAVSEALP